MSSDVDRSLETYVRLLISVGITRRNRISSKISIGGNGDAGSSRKKFLQLM